MPIPAGRASHHYTRFDSERHGSKTQDTKPRRRDIASRSQRLPAHANTLSEIPPTFGWTFCERPVWQLIAFLTSSLDVFWPFFLFFLFFFFFSLFSLLSRLLYIPISIYLPPHTMAAVASSARPTAVPLPPHLKRAAVSSKQPAPTSRTTISTPITTTHNAAAMRHNLQTSSNAVHLRRKRKHETPTKQFTRWLVNNQTGRLRDDEGTDDDQKTTEKEKKKKRKKKKKKGSIITNIIFPPFSPLQASLQTSAPSSSSRTCSSRACALQPASSSPCPTATQPPVSTMSAPTTCTWSCCWSCSSPACVRAPWTTYWRPLRAATASARRSPSPASASRPGSSLSTPSSSPWAPTSTTTRPTTSTCRTCGRTGPAAR